MNNERKKVDTFIVKRKINYTCPYANTELLNPAIQFSTRGAPTNWNISTWKRQIEFNRNTIIISSVLKSRCISYQNIHKTCLSWGCIGYRIKSKCLPKNWQRITRCLLYYNFPLFFIRIWWPHSHNNLNWSGSQQN